MGSFKILKTSPIFLVFFIFFTNVYAQKSSKEIDSVSQLIKKNYATGDLNPNLTLKHVTALYYMSKASKYYPGLITSIFEESRIYYFNGNFDSALAKINEGIDLAKAHDDYNMICQFLLVYHKVLLQLDHLSASKKILKDAEAYNTLVTSKDNHHINTIYILISKADLLVIDEGSDHVEQVLELKKQAYLEALKINDSDKYKKATLIYSLESLAASLARFEKVSEARKYIIIIDQYLLTFPDDAFTIQNLIIKGMTEHAAQNYDQAVNYYTQALIKSKKNNNTYKQYEIYAMISASYGELKDFEKATDFSKKYKHLVDSIDIVKKKSGDVNFINKLNQKVSNDQDSDFGIAKNIGFISICIVLLLLIVLIYVLNQKKNRTVSLEKKSTIPAKNQLITESSIEISDFKNNNSFTQPETIKQLVLLAKEDINTFYIEFKKTYPTFYQSLSDLYPELNVSDINFCSLMKMNFGIKEISQYTNSSTRASEARRYRVIKKMQLNNQDDLYMILSTIN
jgi:tetratricopeptide (TPR) repeat protein